MFASNKMNYSEVLYASFIAKYYLYLKILFAHV